MSDPIRPAWLANLRVVAPANQAMLEQTFLPHGSWIVRHSIDSRALDDLTRRGHRMVSLDDQHTLIAPTLYLLG